ASRHAPRVGPPAKRPVAPAVAAPTPPRELTAQTPPPVPAPPPAPPPTLEQEVPPVVPAAKPKPAPAPQPAHQPTTTATTETQPQLTNELPPPTQTVEGSGG